MSDLGCHSPGPANVPCPVDEDQQAAALAALLPPGWAWEATNDDTSVMSRRLRAIADMLAYLDARSCALLAEFRCHTVDETQAEWDADYGLPDDCGINNLCAKVRAVGGQNCASFVELGEMLGYGICCEDLEQTPQCGPGACLDYTQCAPEEPPRYGGSSLDMMSVGYCEMPEGGADLGHDHEGCLIAGYNEIPEADADAGVEPCPMQPIARDFEHTFPAGVTGCYRPYDLSHYVGNAYHWIVGLDSDRGPGGEWERCDDVAVEGVDLDETPLGTFVPGTPAPPASYAIAGCAITGCTSLCSPDDDPVWCFVTAFRPAHTVPIRRYCSDGAIIR